MCCLGPSIFLHLKNENAESSRKECHILWRLSEHSATCKVIFLAVSPSTQASNRSSMGMLDSIHNVMTPSLFSNAFLIQGVDVNFKGLGTSIHSLSWSGVIEKMSSSVESHHLVMHKIK